MFPRPDRIIVPQYVPPAGIGVLAAAELLGDSKRAVAAALVDLAVRGILGVQRGDAKREGFQLTLRRIPEDDGLPPTRDDLAVLEALFPTMHVGTVTRLSPATRRRLGPDLREAHRQAVARLIGGGLVRERGIIEKAVVFWRKQPTEPTELAHPLVDQLWGLRDYIAWAEADRLAFHQSPAGARVRELDGVALLHLHERLLPYAVLFGLEKEWVRVLGVQFAGVSDDLQGVLDGAEVAVQLIDTGLQVAMLVHDLHEFGDLAGIVDLGDAADGIGAFFGGLGDLL